MLKKWSVGLLVLFLLAFPISAYAQVPDPLPDPSAWVDELSQQIQWAIDGLWYAVLLLHAQLQWYSRR
jgi:hypothetical protein